jgi:hypothetical protein
MAHGSFSFEALQAYEALIAETHPLNFSDGDTHDFTRCLRPNGTIYGSRGKCKQGTEIGAKEESQVKGKRGPKAGGMRLTEKIKGLGAEDLKKVLQDPRVTPKQRAVLEGLLKSKRGVKAPEGRLVKQGTREDRKTSQRGLTREVAQIKRSYSTMKTLVKSPEFDTAANNTRVTNLRLLLNQKEEERKDAALRDRKTQGRDPTTYEADLKNSPKYDKTPGSSSPIPKLVPKDTKALEEGMDTLRSRLSELRRKGVEELTTEEHKVLRESREKLDRLGLQLAREREGKPPAKHSLKSIYGAQGFNAKPELVATVDDLRKRKDIVTNSDGSPRIFYRGVTLEKFADQFKGLGISGDTHYPGRGINGNGTYAAAPSYHDPSEASTRKAIKTAKAYVGRVKSLSSKVTAFALRKDANVVEFSGKTESERVLKYMSWGEKTINEAQKKTGFFFNDVGEAAAALGVHAYTVPQHGGLDYAVLLNRGAVIAAMDSQIPDENE